MTGLWIILCALVLFSLIAILTGDPREWNSRDRKAHDKAVLDDFRDWSAGRMEAAPLKKTGFAALSERERELSAPIPASSSGGNLVCSNCQTTYNRQEVIRLIKHKSPEIFEFSTWTTRFVCKVCRTEIVLSGSRGE